jgi:hypothetical protein
MKDLYSDNRDKVSGVMDDLWDQDQKQKSELVSQWRLNIHFANGAQNLPIGGGGSLVYVNGKMFIDRSPRRGPPMYVTNEIAPITRTLLSYMIRAKPSVDVFAADWGDSEGKKKAKVAKAVLDAKYDLDNEYANSRQAAFWGLATGTAIRKDYWDKSRGGQGNFPVFDELGNEMIDPETGEVVMSNEPSGDNCVAILSPFSLSFDWSFTDLEDLPWIQEAYLVPVEWARKMFTGPGYLLRPEDIKESSELFSRSSALSTFESLKYATSISGANRYNYNQKDKVLIREMYAAPDQEAGFPEGRMILKIGDKLGFEGPSPYYMPFEPVNFHPYSFYIFQPYIGRLLGRSMVEDILPIQMRINELNGAFLENTGTIARPRVIYAENQIKPGTLSGSGSQNVIYKPMPGIEKPAIWGGVPLPAQFFQEKDKLIDQMVRIVGTNFAMQGQAPSGVSAASAIQMLLENANSQLSDTMLSWSRFHEQGFTKKIRTIRKFASRPNAKVENYLRTFAKDLLVEDIEAFTNSDLSDGVFVKIEEASMIPKQETARRELLKELAGLGVFPALQEPSPRGAKVRKEFLSKFGEKGFDEEENSDLEKASWEDDQIKAGKEPAPWEKDNHEIHLACHISEAKKPEFIEQASEEVKAMLLEHIAWHEEQLTLMQQPPPMDPNAPLPPGGEPIPVDQGGEVPPPEQMPMEEAPPMAA